MAKFIQPYFEIMSKSCSLFTIETAGRVCYQSKPRGQERKFAKMLLDRGHESVLEHSSITVFFTVDRGFSHEIVRHRLASFSQESTRYCLYGDKEDIEFIVPSTLYQFSDGARDAWEEAMIQAERFYLKMIDEGARPEQARAVLPNSLKTNIVVTANAREWRHIFKMRTAKAAHPDMRAVMIPLLDEFRKEIPVLFDNVEEAV